MKVGLFLNTQWQEGTQVSVNDLLAQVRAARDGGFASIWLPHHYLVAPMQMLQPMVLLGRLVPETGRMTLGMDILLLPIANPVHVAEEWATLDVLSDGRAVLGVGLGYRPEEFQAFSVPINERAARMAESIRLIRRLWSEERVSFQGKFYSMDNAGLSIRPLRRGGVPIFVAAQVEAAIQRAARVGDGWLIVPSLDMHTCADHVRIYRDALRAAGKPESTEAVLTRECHIGSTRQAAFEECRAALEYKYGAYASWGLQKADIKQSFEEFARDKFIIGDKASVKDEIARYRETLDVDHFIMRPHWPGLPNERAVSTIRALGEIFA
ncbi:MAG: LLM class flavin-dependent oxidoreductase [Acetobacteraceae bacterium]|nr:LLM class flavin-dependent oxidoreductase [Acetobacteraceae bacterium]